MTFRLCGNSHVAALQKGAEALSSPSPTIQIFPLGSGAFETEAFSVREGRHVRMTCQQYAENMRRYTGRDHLDSQSHWGVCMGTHNARVYRNGFWIHAEPSSIARPGMRPVSDGLLDGMILSDQLHIRSFIKQLKDANISFFVISCSPPRLDHHCFAEGVRRETVAYVEARARALFTRWLHSQGIPYIPPPSVAITDEGFLRPEFNAPDLPDGRRDPHHANGDYGALMMEKVYAYLERPRVIPSTPLRISQLGRRA